MSSAAERIVMIAVIRSPEQTVRLARRRGVLQPCTESLSARRSSDKPDRSLRLSKQY